jgi:hypothetical protein
VRRNRAQLNVGIITDQNGRATPSGTGGISATPLFNNLSDPMGDHLSNDLIVESKKLFVQEETGC